MMYKNISFLMLLKENTRIKVFNKTQKILQCSLSFHCSFVILVLQSDHTHAVQHLNYKGYILHHYPIDGTANCFTMLTHSTLVLPFPRNNHLLTINLLTQGTTLTPHTFISDNTELDIFYFRDSNLIALKQTSNVGEGLLTLNYYQCPLKQVSQSLVSYQSEVKQFQPYQVVQKGNNYSLVIWFQTQADKNICKIFMHEVFLQQHQLKSLFRPYSINIDPDIIKGISFRADAMWQTDRHQLLVVAVGGNNLRQNVMPQDQSLYIINTQLQTIRPTHSSLPLHTTMTGEIIFLQDFTAIQGIHLNTQAQTSTSFYFFNHRQEKIEVIDECSYGFLGKLQVSEQQNTNLHQIYYDNLKPPEILVTTRKVMEHRQMYLQMLLHCNPDFDDDILKDIIADLLGCVQQ